MNPYTGKIHGLNCHDEEKVRRFRLEVPEGHIENFYSDSLSDTPLAKLADRAWLVKKGKLSPWPEE
jgi:phosphoserine phosphatase